MNVNILKKINTQHIYLLFILSWGALFFLDQMANDMRVAFIYYLPILLLFFIKFKNRFFEEVREIIFLLWLVFNILAQFPDRENLELITHGFDQTKCMLFIFNAIFILFLFCIQTNQKK